MYLKCQKQSVVWLNFPCGDTTHTSTHTLRQNSWQTKVKMAPKSNLVNQRVLLGSLIGIWYRVTYRSSSDSKTAVLPRPSLSFYGSGTIRDSPWPWIHFNKRLYWILVPDPHGTRTATKSIPQMQQLAISAYNATYKAYKVKNHKITCILFMCRQGLILTYMSGSCPGHCAE